MHLSGDPSLRLKGTESLGDAHIATRATYVKRVHVDPEYKFERIFFQTNHTENGLFGTRYRYQRGNYWTPWLTGSEFYLPLPEKRAGIKEVKFEYYSIDGAGNRENIKSGRIKLTYDGSMKQISNPAVKGRVIDNSGLTKIIDRSEPLEGNK